MWEYETIRVDDDDLDATLAAYGKAGWELASAITTKRWGYYNQDSETQDDITVFKLIFKRSVTEYQM